MKPRAAALLVGAVAGVRGDMHLVCETSVQTGDGRFTIELHPDWGPLGVRRVVKMHDEGFFDGLPFFRVLPGFLIQFGITPDVTKHRKLQALGNVPDDERHDEAPDFEDGIVSFAGYGPDSRSTHLFITLGDQPR